MVVHSNTIERVYPSLLVRGETETYRRRVTMVNTDYSVGDIVPAGLFWAGWKIVEVVEC